MLFEEFSELIVVRKTAARIFRLSGKPAGAGGPRLMQAQGTALSALLLVSLLLTGCFHHQAPPPPPPVTTGPPALPPSITQIPTVPPSMPAPEKPEVSLNDAKPVPPPAPAPKPKRTVRHKRVVDGAASTTAANATTPSPAAAPPSTAGTLPAAGGAETPAPAAQPPAKAPELGQLSAGNGSDSKERSSMMDQIHGLELRLANVKHTPTNDEEAVQIRLFLGKARQATLSDDLDGARTLALKAKVLLDEISDL